MAPIKPGSRGYPPSLEGAIQVDATRGTRRVRLWPQSRGKATKQKTAEQNEWFRQAQWLSKYVASEQMRIARRQTAGTPLMPRDVLTSAMAGRLFVVQEPDGKVRYGVPVKTDVSDSLDLLGDKIGSVLIRAPEGWRRLAPGPAGQVLTSTGVDGLPEWADPTGSGGGGEATSTFTIQNASFENGNLDGWEIVQAPAFASQELVYGGDWSAKIADFGTGTIRTKNALSVPDDWTEAVDAGDVNIVMQAQRYNGNRFDDGIRGGIEFFDENGALISDHWGPRHAGEFWNPINLDIAMPPSTRGIRLRAQGGFYDSWVDSFVSWIYNVTLSSEVGLALPVVSQSAMPTASPPIRMVFVNDLDTGPEPAFNDGSVWRRASDKTVIS